MVHAHVKMAKRTQGAINNKSVIKLGHCSGPIIHRPLHISRVFPAYRPSVPHGLILLNRLPFDSSCNGLAIGTLCFGRHVCIIKSKGRAGKGNGCLSFSRHECATITLCNLIYHFIHFYIIVFQSNHKGGKKMVLQEP